MLVIAPVDHSVSSKLADELALVERRFGQELQSDLACVNDLATHVERYRGKMLRPMLVLVSGMACSKTGLAVTHGHRVAATVVEMVHMATLVHDDILDEAVVRRQGKTVNQLRGNETAVMLGDYLISHAYHLCSSLSGTLVSRMIAKATNTTCEGELLQLANRHNLALSHATYYEIIRRKTASLCGVCCRLGAVLHDQPVGVCDALETYGEKVGQAFQIIDDILDLTGDEEIVGKTLGRDLEKGKLTLPLIHAINHVQGGQNDVLLGLLRQYSQGQANPELALQIRHILIKSGSLDASHEVALSLIDQAKAALCVLADTPAKNCLLSMADAVITRKL